MSGLLKFSAAMALIGVAVAAFAYGISKMGGPDILKQLGAGAASIAILALAVWGISKIPVDLAGVLEFSLAMGIIGLAMIPFAFAAQMLTGVDWMSVLAGVGVMALVMIGLALLGGEALAVGWLILLGAGVLALAGLALMVAAEGLLMTADAFTALSAINWTGFSAMGGALLSVIPGLIGFGIASLFFANPFTLFGLGMMVLVLGGLAAVIGILAPAMTEASNGMASLAGNMERLQTATDKLSLDKLAQLKEVADSLASASAAGAVTSAIANLATALGSAGKGGAGGGGIQKHEINLKINGRTLQTLIIEDNELTH